MIYIKEHTIYNMKQYPKIFKEHNIEIANMGGNVIVQEKIDGSQYKVRIDQNQNSNHW